MNLLNITKRYAGYRVDRSISYATVRDFSDSADNLPMLTSARDLKDVQRPWVLKAIIGSIPIGAELLEIGAGTPQVADLLAQIGYHVTVIDPYDGTANGPNEFERLKKTFPRIRFLRGKFPEILSSIGHERFDCIYSISVLEHIDPQEIEKFTAAIHAFSKSNSAITVHAIDHVLSGKGDRWHKEGLLKWCAGFGIAPSMLHETLDRATIDPETYFLSAEAHNLWRGNIPYDDFPMRRCISMQVACALSKP